MNYQKTSKVRWKIKKVKNTSRSSRSRENIDWVRESVNDHPEISIRRRSQQVGFSERKRILHNDLTLKAYKPLDRLKRHSFHQFHQ